MSTLKTTNIAHPSSASNNIVLDSSGGVDMDAFTVSGSAPADSVNLDASGRLLVGTSSAPTGANSQYARISVIGNTGDSTSWAALNLGIGASPTAADTELGRITFTNSTAGEFANIRAFTDGAVSSNSDCPGRLVFSTTADGASSPTERMRIQSDGVVQLSSNLHITDGNFLLNVSADRIKFNGTAGPFYVLNENSVGVRLSSGSTSWAAQSDERLKTNLQEIDNGLEKTSQLRAVTGRYLTDKETVRRSFLIAQDVQAVLPEAVDADSDEQGTLSLRYTDVIPLLVAALKESKERIETLEAKVAALEAS